MSRDAEMKRAQGIAEILSNFEDELQENPRMVKAMAEISLDYKRGDVTAATKSLHNYLDWRLKTFGHLEDQCVAEDEKLEDQLACNFLHVSPTRMSTGAAVVYISMKHHDPSVFSTADTIKCMHYLLITAMMEEPALGEKGFVLVNNMVDVELHHLDMHFPVAIASAVGRSIPIRVSSVVMVDPPFLIRFIIPVLKSVLPAKLSERLHVVTDHETLPEVVHATEQADLPVELGGEVEFTTHEHVKRLHTEKWCV